LRFKERFRTRAAWGAVLAAAALIACGPAGHTAVPALATASATASAGATPTATASPTAWDSPLPHPIIIADRGNSRIIEVTPDKQVVWTFPAPGGLPAGQSFVGGDDAFFTPGGGQIISNEEMNGTIAIIDYATRQVVWQYGHPGVEDYRPGFLNYPDDAYLLPDGVVAVSDIRNCRELFINQQKQVVAEWGQAAHCTSDPPKYLSSPNGDTPLPNGDLLITEINGGAGDSRAVRITRDGQVVWNVRIPDVFYGSDAQLLPDGDILTVDYSRPGKIVIFNPATGKIDWEYKPASGEAMLDHPSIAEALPNGNILVSDDYRDRLVVIDRATKAIVWQYGHTDVAGTAPGFLNTPDGMDSDVYHHLGGH